MKKKWAVYMSIFILLLNFIPNIFQVKNVIADGAKSHKESIELIHEENLDISYSMYESSNEYEWNIKYKYTRLKENQEFNLKLSFSHDEDIQILPDDSWDNSNNKFLESEFTEDREGVLTITSPKSITDLSLHIQMEEVLSSSDLTVQNEISVENNIDSSFKLYIPELKTQEDNNHDIGLSNENKKNSEETDEQKERTNVKQGEESSGLAFNYPSNFGSLTSLLDPTQNYVNIEPEYIDDSSGIYPKVGWQPTNNQNVINHEGRLPQAQDWSTGSQWDGNPENKTSAYIQYPGKMNAEDFAIRKYARETTTPGLLDVYLNVRGNTQNPIKPVDIVLVVDMSGSMVNEGREEAVKDGVKSFLSSISGTAYDKYVNVGLVGYSDSIKSTVQMDNLSNANHIDNLNNALNKTFTGGTFTQLGIQSGTKMLSDDTSENEKMMILLTDGVPTYSYHVTSASKVDDVVYGEQFNTTREGAGNTSKLSSPYLVNGISINDTWAATLGEARISKNNGAEIHTLGIQLGADGSYLTSDQVRARTSLIASTGLYQDANTAEEITTYLKNQASVVLSRFNTISDGSILDPIGSQYRYNGMEVNIKSVGQDTIENLPIAQINNESVEVSNLNLGAEQEIQIHYQVRLNTETEDFNPNQWYQINGRTTLTPNGNNPENKVDFGVPSARLPGIDLNLEKKWVANEENITDDIEITIKRTGGTEEKDWSKKVTLSKTENWGKKVENLIKYNNLGEEFVYEITDENVDQNEIFDWEIKEDSTTIINFEKFQLQLLKTSTHTSLPLANVQFQLKDANNKIVFEGETNSEGQLNFDGVRLKYGESYTLYEVKADGHILEGPWKIKTEISSEHPTLTINDEKIDINEDYNRFMITLKIDNDINVENFNNSISIDKRDVDTEESLNGAVFNLYQLNDIEENLENLDALDSMNNLLPGLYALQESQSPNGYYKDDEIHYFKVNFDATIVPLNSEGEVIEFLDKEETGTNGFILTNSTENVVKLSLRFYNRAAPPLYLEVEKIDDDFTSPLAGVTFELTSMGRVKDAKATERSSSMFTATTLFDNSFDTETLLLQSNEDGKLSMLDSNGNIVPDAKPISLDYDTKYSLVKKSTVGLFPDFGETAQWLITTPNMNSLKEHEEDNNIQITGEELVETPDEAISQTIEKPATALGIVSLIKTENPEFKSVSTIDSKSKRSRDESDVVNETLAYTISFEIHSNVTHSFTIEKVDGTDNFSMDTQFSLRWVEKFNPEQDFSSLKSLDIGALELSGNDISSASAQPIDATTGATLSTIKGTKTLDHMGRGNLYIISEETPPEGYQNTNTVIVAYMDKAQGYGDSATIHIRLARRSENNPQILEFGDLEDFVEYKGGVQNGLGIVFANYKEGKIPETDNNDNSSKTNTNNTAIGNNSDTYNKKTINLPTLGSVGVGVGGIILITLGYTLNKRKNK